MATQAEEGFLNSGRFFGGFARSAAPPRILLGFTTVSSYFPTKHDHLLKEGGFLSFLRLCFHFYKVDIISFPFLSFLSPCPAPFPSPSPCPPPPFETEFLYVIALTVLKLTL